MPVIKEVLVEVVSVRVDRRWSQGQLYVVACKVAMVTHTDYAWSPHATRLFCSK